MMNISLKPVAAALFLAGGLMATGVAQAGISLNTSGLKANATLTFSVPAFGSSTGAGITFTPLGNMTKTGDVVVVDEFGVEDLVPQFNLPVTKANVSIGWDLKVHANWGSSVRSALKLDRGTRTTTLANFVVNFNDKVLYADFITPGGTNLNRPLYVFEELVPQKVSFKNLVLNQSVTIGKLILSQEAQNVLGDNLALSPPLRATLVTQDWGTIAILVTSYKRSPAVSDKPFTAADL